MTDFSPLSRAWCSSGQRGPVLFHETTFSSLRVEGSALFAQHWAEANASADVPLDVDWEQFERIEAAGFEVCVAARLAAVLIGYAVYIWHPSTHYRGFTVAEADAFFLREEDRRGSVGIRLFRFAEDLLRARGVHQVHQRVKLHVRPGRGRSDLGPLFRFLGYDAIETLYRKRIG